MSHNAALPPDADPDLQHLRRVAQMANMSDRQIWRDAMAECVRNDQPWTLIAAALEISRQELSERFRPVPGEYVDPLSHNEWHVRSADRIIIVMPGGGQVRYENSADEFVRMAARDRLELREPRSGTTP
ncbi:hypothetical protein [Amycolatopsis sp. NBC_00438]|uniref:hypothetical protein n=1 Tax=Amycolatopsis sp. NBC_00438 TaxID=2903558 RepID=UPI002E1F97A2